MTEKNRAREEIAKYLYEVVNGLSWDLEKKKFERAIYYKDADEILNISFNGYTIKKLVELALKAKKGHSEVGLVAIIDGKVTPIKIVYYQ